MLAYSGRSLVTSEFAFFRLGGMVLVVPPFIVYGNGGWRVPCNDVAGEGRYTAVEHGPVRIREGEFLNSPEDSYVALRRLDGTVQ